MCRDSLPAVRGRRALSFAAALLLVHAFSSDAAITPANAFFHRLTPEDGLSHARVYAVAQDRTGFLWFGTHDGLDRYDGRSIKSFRHDLTNPDTISENDVSTILFDEDGVGWIGTWGGGLDRFDPQTEKFRHYPVRPHGLRDGKIQTLFKDSRGDLWIGTYGGGLTSMNRRSGEMRTFRHGTSALSDDRVWSLAEGPKGTLWIATKRGLDVLDLASRRFVPLESRLPGSARFRGTLIRALFRDKDGYLWIGSERGIDRINLKSGASDHFEHDPKDPATIGNNVINAIMQDRSGTIWIATNLGGLNRFDRPTPASAARFTRFMNDPASLRSISHDDVRNLYEDATNVLWVTTRGGGVNRLDLKPPKFVTYSHDPSNRTTLSEGGVNALLEDRRGELWIGTLRGLDRYDRTSEAFVHYDDVWFLTPSGRKREVASIHEDRGGQLWIGFYRGGLCRFDREAGRCSRIYREDPNDPTAIPDDTVNEIFEDRSGSLWIGTLLGLRRFDRTVERFEKFPPKASPITQDSIWIIRQDAEGSLWIGTDSRGLFRLDPRTGRWSEFAQQPNGTSALSNNRLRWLHDDGRGTLWIATAHGLNAFEKKSGRFRSWFKNDGLPSSNLYAILGDGRGRLWISTDAGLSRFDPVRNEFHNYSVSDGLQGRRFQAAAHRARDGRLMFGGTSGYSMFDPDAVVDNALPPPVVLTSVRTFGGASVPLTPMLEGRTLTFSREDSFLAFEFAALEFTAPEENEYKYKLAPLDADWIDAGNRNVATYSHIPPGRYRFHVKASNSDHVWNEKGLTLPIRIAPALWQTWWFRLAAVLLAGSVVWLVLRYRLHAVELQRRHRERTQFLANMSHELRTPLNAIIGFSEILRERLGGRIEEREFMFITNILSSGEHLLEIVNDILDLSRIESGHVEMQPTQLSVGESIDAACQLLRGISSKHGIGFQVEAENGLPVLNADALKIKQVIYNLLSNAVKFSPDHSTVRIAARQVSADRSPLHEPSIEIVVADEGIGIAARDHQMIFEPFHQVEATLSRRFGGTGLGLAIVRKFVELHKGRVTVDSEIGKGSVFTVTLPLSYRGAVSKSPQATTLEPARG